MPGARAPEEQRRRQLVDAGLAVAARDRLDRLTVRRVAAEAGVSPGLVFHHFTDKRTLLLAVLDRLVERTVPDAVELTEPVPAVPADAGDRLLAHVRGAVERIRDERELIELLFDYWVVGTRDPQVRGRIATAMRGYRELLVPAAEAAIAEEPDRFAGTDGDRLAAMVVAFVLGHAVQSVLDPAAIDVDGVVTTLDALIPRPRAAPPG